MRKLKRIIKSLRRNSGLKDESKRNSKSMKMDEKKKLQVSIAERLTRFNESDEVYLGELAEKFINSEIGVLVEAICNGLADTVLSDLDNVDATKAGIKLGQASAYRNVISNIEKLVVKKESLLRPQDDIEEVETDISEVPNPRMYQGMRGVV